MVILTSSFVVWLEETKYPWNPVKPTIDQTEKKQMMASRIVASVKETQIDCLALECDIVNEVQSVSGYGIKNDDDCFSIPVSVKCRLQPIVLPCKWVRNNNSPIVF